MGSCSDPGGLEQLLGLATKLGLVLAQTQALVILAPFICFRLLPGRHHDMATRWPYRAIVSACVLYQVRGAHLESGLALVEFGGGRSASDPVLVIAHRL